MSSVLSKFIISDIGARPFVELESQAEEAFERSLRSKIPSINGIFIFFISFINRARVIPGNMLLDKAGVQIVPFLTKNTFAAHASVKIFSLCIITSSQSCF